MKIFNNKFLASCAATAALAWGAVLPARAQSSAWINTAGGSWAMTTDWSNNVIAGGYGDTADFSQLTLPASQIVTLDGSRTIGKLIFGDQGNAYGWTVSTGTGGPLTLNNGGSSPTITVSNMTATISAVVAGSAGLTLSGAGTLILSGANTYTGTTIINAGTFAVGGAGTLSGGSYAGSVTDNSLFLYEGSASQTLSGAITGTGALTVSGPGTFTLANSGDTYSGPTTVNSGILLLQASTGGSGNIRNSTIVINPGGELDLNASDALGYSVTLPVTNRGIIKKINSQAETMYRPMYLSGGSLVTTLSGTPQFETFGGYIATIANTTNFISGPGEFGLRTSSCYISNGVSSVLTISTVIYPYSGGCPLNKLGPGTMILTANNTYSGNTVVSNGILEVDGSIPATSVILSSGATLSGSGTINGPATIPAGATLAPGTMAVGTNAVTILEMNSTLSLAGNAIFKISKTGGSASSDNVSGLTSVTCGGILTVTNITSDGTPLAAGDAFSLINAGSYAGGFTAYNLPALPAGLNWDLSQVSVNGQLAVVSGVPVPLFYPPSGGYQGAVTVTIIGDPGSTIYYTTDGSTPTTSSPSGPSPLVVIAADNANTLIQAFAQIGGVSSAISSASYATVNTPTWISASGGSWASTVNWSNGVVANGSGTTADFNALTLSANEYITFDTNLSIGQMVFGDLGNTYTWEIDPGSGGPLTLAAGTNTPTISVQNTSATLAVPLAGSSGLAKAGAGTLMLTGVSTYSGATTISGGTLTFGDTGDIGSGAYASAITNNGNLVYSSSQYQTFSGVISGVGTLTQNGPGELTLSGINSFSGGTTVNGGVLFANGPNNINSSLGGGNVTINSGGTVMVGGPNSFVGTSPGTTIITINAGGAVNNNSSTCHLGALVLNGGSLNAIAPNTADGNWNFDYGVSTPGTSNVSLITGGNAALTQTGGTVFNIGSGDTLNVATVLAHPSNIGDKGLIKSGPGTMTLSSANTYTSSTVVNDGLLQVTGSIATGTVTVNSGGTLGGNGTIGGPTAIAAGGTIELMTNSISGLFVDSSLTLSGNSIFNVTKTGGSAASDTIGGLTGVTYGGTLTLSNITSDGTPFAAGDVFTLFSLNSGSYSGGFAAYTLPPLPSGLSWDVTQSTVNGQITVVSGVNATPIFSPSTGEYVGALSVKITSAAGWTIYYTTDGSTPTTSSPSGLSPVSGVIVPANTNLTITAFAKLGATSSSISSASYSTVSTPTWINANGGSWATLGNWSNNVVPNGNGVTADFSTLALPAEAFVTLDGVFTVGNLIFGDTGGTNTWEIDPGTGGPLTLNAGSNSPTITVNDGKAILTVPLAGSSGFTKNGPGILDLTVSELYTGGTIVNAGSLYLDLGGDSTASTLQGMLTVNTGATCWVNQPYALGDTTEIGLTNLYLNGGTLGGPGECTTYGLSCEMSGGTLNLAGAFYLGAPNILASDAVTLTSFSNAVTSEMAPGGGLVLRGGFGQTNFVFTVARGATNGVDLQVDAAISENGASCSIIKAGSGTLALDDANSYSGRTVVSNGTLLVNGSTGAGTVIVNAGATVGGVGTIGGSVTNNGTLAPGSNSVGTLATGGVTFEPGSTLLFRLTSATNDTEQSLLAVNGTLDLEGLSGGQFAIKLVSMANPNTPGLLTDFNPAASYVWTVVKATGFITNINSLGQLVLDTSGFQNAFPGTFSLGFNVAAGALQIIYTPSALQSPVLSGVTSYSAGAFTLTFSGPSGQGYQVLMSTNLALPLADWTVLASGSFGVAPVNYTDTGATNTARFYSIKSP